MGLDNIRKTSSRLDQMENGHYDDLFIKRIASLPLNF